MSDPNPQPQNPVGDRIEKFIAAVEEALAKTGMSPDERQNIAGDLRSQIEEMLSDRTRQSGNPVAIEDVEAVLAELDPPDSYIESAQPREADSPREAEHPRHEHCGHHGFRRGGPRWFWRRRRVAQAMREAIHSFSPFGNPVFQGMTERSRTALAIAKTEAQRLRHDFVGTEHLLLGLILEGTGIAAKVLADLNVTRDWAREEAARLVPPGTGPHVPARLPLTPRVRQAFEEARLEARNLGHDYLGTEHLLLGLLAVPGVGGQIIANRGLTRAQVRAEILARISPSGAQPVPANPSPTVPITFWPSTALQEIQVGENRYKIIAAGTDTGGAYTAVEATLTAPDGLGLRTHTREDLSIYVLDGSLRLRVGTRTIEVNKGDFSRIPRNTAHDLHPTGSPAHIILIATPAGLEEFIPTLSRESAPQHGITPG
jgi:mannose-6-phosphate isomerase-like protein (cupin superfamily)